ncbi:MAG: hypothetical protein ACYDEB_09385 [Dehalococcoidia bacterium]
MQTRTIRPDQPVATPDNAVVDREVVAETVRTRERVAGAPATGAPVAAAPIDATPAPRTFAGQRSGGYFETLPERLTAVALVVLTALEGLLATRFLLAAFNANAGSGFVGFIHNVSWPFVRPFSNIFTNRSWNQGVVEISTLVAMGVYLLVFALIAMLVTAVAPRIRGDEVGAPRPRAQ